MDCFYKKKGVAQIKTRSKVILNVTCLHLFWAMLYSYFFSQFLFDQPLYFLLDLLDIFYPLDITISFMLCYLLNN